jgi:hypothetical protein
LEKHAVTIIEQFVKNGMSMQQIAENLTKTGIQNEGIMVDVIEAQEFRRRIGGGVLDAQMYAKDIGASPEEVIPEIIAALLSLAAYVTENNASLCREDFLAACLKAAEAQWPKFG